MRIGWSVPLPGPFYLAGTCGVRVIAAPGPIRGHCREAGRVLTPTAQKGPPRRAPGASNAGGQHERHR